MLKDLISQITPGVVPSNSGPRFVRQLTSATAPALLEAKQCPLLDCQMPTSAICPLVFK